MWLGGGGGGGAGEGGKGGVLFRTQGGRVSHKPGTAKMLLINNIIVNRYSFSEKFYYQYTIFFSVYACFFIRVSPKW